MSGRPKVKKSDGAFRTISEVSQHLNVPQHVLRFWESKFAQVNPLKRGGGRRYYRPDDIRLLERVRDLLYVDGFTIKGVQRMMRERGVKALLAEGEVPIGSAGEAKMLGTLEEMERHAVKAAIAQLTEIRKILSPPKI
ncbi:MAG: MerR family transcriptional regulator [Pseudomonadota bacterium]|nr:MerR family transcriptional regulator [Pseudomonadota bacterium]